MLFTAALCGDSVWHYSIAVSCVGSAPPTNQPIEPIEQLSVVCVASN